MNEQHQANIQRLLQDEFTKAKLRNPQVSLRSFARKLSLNPSALSEILNGKRRVSQKLTIKILQNISWDPQKIEEFFQNKSEREIKKSVRNLEADQFRMISDWYHFGILALAETKNFKSDPEWIAKRLNIKIQEVELALERLMRLGMLQKTNTGRYKVTGTEFHSPDEVANAAIRGSHSQTLDHARTSLERVPIDHRDFTSITMAIDPTQLPKAKKMIREFLTKLSTILESGNKQEVYQMAVHLFPLSNLEQEEEKRGRK